MEEKRVVIGYLTAYRTHTVKSRPVALGYGDTVNDRWLLSSIS